MRADNLSTTYKVHSYDFLGFLGDLGGFIEILYLSFRIVAGLISSKMLTAAIISSAYRIQETPPASDFHKMMKRNKPMTDCETV